MLAIMDNPSHPLHKLLDKLKSSFSNRLNQPAALRNDTGNGSSQPQSDFTTHLPLSEPLLQNILEHLLHIICANINHHIYTIFLSFCTFYLHIHSILFVPFCVFIFSTSVFTRKETDEDVKRRRGGTLMLLLSTGRYIGFLVHVDIFFPKEIKIRQYHLSCHAFHVNSS